MDAFEKRARERNLPASEVSDTYHQMNRLLGPEQGAVGSAERQLAAKSFMSHAADPKSIDQGMHNTCNVTAVAERLMTRNPSKMAEMVTSSAMDGKWTAPDGREIKLRPQDLQPGREESTFPPAQDRDRSYATQLMNLAMVNDSVQRRMPPQYYGQERATPSNRTGETLSYADGTPVGDGAFKGLFPHEFTAIGKRINGEDRFAIVHDGVTSGEGVIDINSGQALRNTLQEMKDQGRLPAVIQVDVNDPAFGGTGNPASRGKWHVVSVTGYDPATGRVQISNQWGKQSDRDINVDDLYRSTRPR
jgi:hypothetical protein